MLSYVSYYSTKVQRDYVLQNKGTSQAEWVIEGPSSQSPWGRPGPTERWTLEGLHSVSLRYLLHCRPKIRRSWVFPNMWREREEMLTTSSVPGNRPGTCRVPGLEREVLFSRQPGWTFTDGKQGKQMGLTPCQIPSTGCSLREQVLRRIRDHSRTL